jgi:DNA-binding NtrC family response regulator
MGQECLGEIRASRGRSITICTQNQQEICLSESTPQRLVVAYVKDTRIRNRLGKLDCELQVMASGKRMLATQYHRHPRLFFVQAELNASEQTCELVASLRHQRPLTDVVVWAPKASGSAVRSYFRAGAKDVFVSQVAGSLIASIEEYLRHQQRSPGRNEVARKRSTSSRFESLLSRSAGMWDLFELCQQIAPTEANVLIVGETGTGKELLARAIHRRSGRRGRFVAVNCASVPAELINSELFGHEQGAFTGADRAKQGLVTHAHEGTLFLDEIGDMSPAGQQSLLRMLQERRVRPVGSLVETKIDVRVLAATNVPLDDAVREGKFREDLFYRLDVIRLNVLPLRERPEDILFLFGHFIKRLCKEYGVERPIYADTFLDALSRYQWPGNVRQLENFSERLVLARPQRTLTARDFVKLRNTSFAHPPRPEPNKPEDPRQIRLDADKPLQENIGPLLQSLERDYLRLVLTKTSGRVEEAAQRAGISRRTLLRKMKLHGIDKTAFKLP